MHLLSSCAKIQDTNKITINLILSIIGCTYISSIIRLQVALDDLVCHKLEGGVEDQDQRWQSSSPQGCQAFLSSDLHYAVWIAFITIMHNIYEKCQHIPGETEVLTYHTLVSGTFGMFLRVLMKLDALQLQSGVDDPQRCRQEYIYHPWCQIMNLLA